MIIEHGDKLLISNRRFFERDESRFFIGRAIACEGPLVKAEGYSFVRDLSTGLIVKKEEQRIKILSLDSPGYIVYQLSREIDLQKVDFKCGNGDAVLVEGNRPVMNLSERTHCGQF